MARVTVTDPLTGVSIRVTEGSERALLWGKPDKGASGATADDKKAPARKGTSKKK